MQNWKDYLWLVKTNKGDFFFTVIGDWTQEEAEKKLRRAAFLLDIEILELVPRKRVTGTDEMTNTVYQELKPESPLGFELMAGKSLWEALGLGSEYKAKRKKVKKELKEELKKLKNHA